MKLVKELKDWFVAWLIGFYIAGMFVNYKVSFLKNLKKIRDLKPYVDVMK